MNRVLVAAAVACGIAAAGSAETLNYRYDAQGRLIQSFSTKSGLRSDYGYDAADNRQRVVAQVATFVLPAGQSITSPDGRFRFTMQSDGNLVLYGPSGGLWGSGTNGTNADRAVMQADGNLVIRNAAGQAFWGSGTDGHPASLLKVQSDGNVVIYDGANVPIWATGTGGR